MISISNQHLEFRDSIQNYFFTLSNLGLKKIAENAKEKIKGYQKETAKKLDEILKEKTYREKLNLYFQVIINAKWSEEFKKDWSKRVLNYFKTEKLDEELAEELVYMKNLATDCKSESIESMLTKLRKLGDDFITSKIKEKSVISNKKMAQNQ